MNTPFSWPSANRNTRRWPDHTNIDPNIAHFAMIDELS
jgi:hypothetical protein